MDYKNDFYSAINQEWLKEKKLSENQTHFDHFLEISEKIDNGLYQSVNNWLETGCTDNTVEDFVLFYHAATDFSKRESLGIEPFLPILNKYRSLRNFEDYCSKILEFEVLGLPNLLPFHVAPDLFNSSKNVIWLGTPELTFPDISYYEGEYSDMVLENWCKSQKRLLVEFGLSIEESDYILHNVIAFDKTVIKYLANPTSDVLDNYNVHSINDFYKFLSALPLEEFITHLVDETPEIIILSDKVFWKKHSKQLYSEEMWEYIKAKLIYGVITMYSSCLTKRIDALSSNFREMLFGIEDNSDDNQKAYELTKFALGDSLSQWYAKKVLTDDDLVAVTSLFNKIIKQYKKHVEQSTELSSDTRQKIIDKLDNIVVQVGGPVDYHNKERLLSSEANLIEMVSRILSYNSQMKWKKLSTLNTRDEWDIRSFTVDAYYYAQMNKVVFPAGLLQKPFYSREYSEVKNLARIGFLMAHEISHGFDIEGLRFDEHGNYGNCISDRDKSYFSDIYSKIRSKYDNQSLDGYAIDSIMTLSENIADIAGFNCIEEIVSNIFPESLEEFYVEFTSLWKIVYRPEYLEMFVLTDPHLPNKLRVNGLLSNSKNFLNTYNISAKDKMWVNPEERLSLW